MKYSDDFKKDMLSVFGDQAMIEKLLDDGSVQIGALLTNLDDRIKITPDVIIDAFEASDEVKKDKLNDLYKLAKKKALIDDLKTKWTSQFHQEEFIKNYNEIGRK